MGLLDRLAGDLDEAARLGQVNDVQLADGRQRLEQVRGRLVAFGMNVLDATIADGTARVQALVAAGCDLRDAYEALAAEAQAGRTPAAELRQRLDELARAFAQLDWQEAEVVGRVGTAEAIEADPAAWADEHLSASPEMLNRLLDVS